MDKGMLTPFGKTDLSTSFYKLGSKFRSWIKE